MGVRKKWAWNKIDWDERIYQNTVVFQEDLVEAMNCSELVEVLNLRGVRAHRGMQHDELVEALHRSLRGEEVKIEHPFDYLRRRLHWFLELHWERIKDQLSVRDKESFFLKHDAEVLYKYAVPLTKRNIETEMKKHGYQD